MNGSASIPDPRAGNGLLRVLICGGDSVRHALGADTGNAVEMALDNAYRSFATARRRFVVADIPAGERHAAAMMRAASAADLAVLAVDARRGVSAPTRRYLCIVALMGVRKVVLAVEKMDAVEFGEAVFRAIADEFAALAAEVGIADAVSIPVSARDGDDVIGRSADMPWYTGPALLSHLETVAVPDSSGGAFRFPVERVTGPEQPFRGVAGMVTGGRVSVGDPVKVLPLGRESTLARIVAADGDRVVAETGDAVTLVLSDAIDGAGRGAVVVAGGGRKPEMAVVDQLQAHLLWLGGEALVPGRPYRLRIGAADAVATVMDIKYRLDADNRRRLAARVLAQNEVGVVTISLDRPIPIDRFADNRATGALVLIDRDSAAAVAAGTVDHPLRRATNVVWHESEVDKATRAAAMGQRPMCFWFTGLSGSGKSTVANMVDKRLAAAGRHAYVLDGDNVRHGLNRDLGFTEGDRVENIRRIAEVARLMVDAGLIVLVCAISPFRRDREMARALFGEGEFVEVYVSTPLDVCEARDPKGLYRRARAGEIPNFTGISAPYEPPLSPDITLTHESSPADLAEQVVGKIG